MSDEMKGKIIAALEQADIHYDEQWDHAEDAPRDFDPLDVLGDFEATAIGVTGDYMDDSGRGSTTHMVLLNHRFLAEFHLILPQYCDDESDAHLSIELTDLGEEPVVSKKVAYAKFAEETNRLATDAVSRVFISTTVYGLSDQDASRFYQDMANGMHAAANKCLPQSQGEAKEDKSVSDATDVRTETKSIIRDAEARLTAGQPR